MLSIFQAQSLECVLLYARDSTRISHACFLIYRMSETRRPILRRVFVYSFSHDYFRNPTMLLERKREWEQETDLEERWKELSTVLKISLRWTGCLSKGNVCTGVMQISPNVRRRTAWQRQIIRGVRRCILFMQIFMKFSWSGCDAARKVWARCRVRLVFEVPKYAILIQCSLSGYIQLQTLSEAFPKMLFVFVIRFTETVPIYKRVFVVTRYPK